MNGRWDDKKTVQSIIWQRVPVPHRARVKVEEGGVSGLVAPVCGVEGGAEVELVSEGVAGPWLILQRSQTKMQ